MPLHFKAYQAALGEELAPYLTEDVFYELAGIPAAPFLEIVRKQNNLEFDPEAVADHKEKLFGEILHEVKAIAAVEEVIRDYHEVMPMAVASGGTRENITRTLEILGLLPYFEVIVSADDVEHGKPSPDIFLEAARRIGIEPAHCLVFEDGDMGIKAAQAAGMEYVDVRTWNGA